MALEPPIGDTVREALEARGHDVGTLGRYQAGGAQGILRLGRGWAAGSDPRKDGHAAGR